MNTYTESIHAVEQDNARFPKFITGSVVTRLSMAFLAVGLLLAVPRASAATKLSTADNEFILAAAQGGMTEVQLGELTSKNAKRQDVKEFGHLMVKDHTSINNDLKALAAQKGVTLPDSLDAQHQAQLDKMTALLGSDFDDAYIAGMIKGHKETAREFKAESTETNDADIKRFLDKSIPVVESHLNHVSAMKK